MSTWTDAQHTDYADKREDWYEANQPSWICADCERRVVEYAPKWADEECDHIAYCARCVDHHVFRPGDDEFDFGKRVEFDVTKCYSKLLPHRCFASGSGAQSYAEHVKAGTI